MLIKGLTEVWRGKLRNGRQRKAKGILNERLGCSCPLLLLLQLLLPMICYCCVFSYCCYLLPPLLLMTLFSCVFYYSCYYYYYSYCFCQLYYYHSYYICFFSAPTSVGTRWCHRLHQPHFLLLYVGSPASHRLLGYLLGCTLIKVMFYSRWFRSRVYGSTFCLLRT